MNALLEYIFLCLKSLQNNIKMNKYCQKRKALTLMRDAFDKKDGKAVIKNTVKNKVTVKK